MYRRCHDGISFPVSQNISRIHQFPKSIVSKYRATAAFHFNCLLCTAERRTLFLWWTNEWIALLLLALPGSVIGIGLISLWNTKATSFIYASPAILILGYLAQYAILPTRVVAASLHAVPRSLEQAAWLSGAGWIATLRLIVAPLARRGLVAAWLISFVFALRDVAISIVVYPPGADTLPVRILTLMANGAPSVIAALCIILIAVTLLPLAAAGLWLKFSVARP